MIMSGGTHEQATAAAGARTASQSTAMSTVSARATVARRMGGQRIPVVVMPG
jgi:hypothetical protein